MSEKTFDFDSGDLSLDFANTLDWHASDKPEETLNQYEDLVSWGEEAGLVSVETARRLRRLAVEQPQQTQAAYVFALRVREAIYRIFSSRYAGKSIPETDLALLNSLIREAMAHLEIRPVDGGMRWEWSPEIDGINLILWPVARSAAELLTSERASRVHECEDDRGCGFLFIDQSKNQSRRWCSMDSCGNRAKARRHYLKAQAG
jgi:predicted RNA-binding Zn ribbon-like protein